MSVEWISNSAVVCGTAYDCRISGFNSISVCSLLAQLELEKSFGGRRMGGYCLWMVREDGALDVKDMERNDLEDGRPDMEVWVHGAGWDVKHNGTLLVCFTITSYQKLEQTHFGCHIITSGPLPICFIDDCLILRKSTQISRCLKSCRQHT